TNLVLLERGQPLHAFDLDKLAGHTIVIRRARAGEKIATLDGQERTLTDEDVAICDEAHPVAVAGVMGGSSSEVSASTRRVLLESAYFSPARVRRTARRLGLHTEASHRFERGVDPEGVLDAARACADWMQRLSGARLAGAPIDLYPKRIEPVRLALRASRTRALLGLELPAARQAEILSALGLEVDPAGETIHVLVPTRRPDLTREVDLIEEIARVHGFDSVPATVPPLRRAPGVSPPPASLKADRARDALRGLGFDELSTYAFVPPAHLAALGYPESDRRARPIRLQNPIREEQSAMRTSLAVGLLSALARNLLRGEGELRLFEVGEIFLRRDGAPADTPAEERRQLAGVMSGHREGWLKPGEPLDLFDVKGVVVELLSALGHVADFEPSREPWLHPGVQARVSILGREVGRLGEVHPDLRAKLGIEARAFAFELDLDALGAAPPLRLAELPRFPAVTRDLSFFIAAEVSAGAIRAAIDRARDPLCVEVKVLEDYREPGRVPAGKKGMLWSFTYRAPDRTLTDAEVQSAHERLLAALKSALELELR
ncbi:MAG TPA: phenylalanine--tRNA ligase subunit beta, partial [Polyangia bacterium]